MKEEIRRKKRMREERWTIVDNSEGLLELVAASEGIINQETYHKIRANS